MFLFVPSIKQGKAHNFARPFRGPYRVVSLYENGADIRPVDRPKQSTISVSLNQLRKCPTEICALGDSTLTHKEDSPTAVDIASREIGRDDPEAGTVPKSRPWNCLLPRHCLLNDALVDVPTTERTCSATESQHAEAMPRRRVQLGGKWVGRLRSRKTVEATVP